MSRNSALPNDSALDGAALDNAAVDNAAPDKDAVALDAAAIDDETVIAAAATRGAIVDGVSGLHQPQATVLKTVSSPMQPPPTLRLTMSDARLRKHADYQRVYKSSRKHSSQSMSYFFSPRGEDDNLGPRIGLTAGRVMGKAVDRNRIKRRMREAIRHHVPELGRNVDVILHPRRCVLTIDFGKLNAEVGRIFASIHKCLQSAGRSSESEAILPSPPTTLRDESMARH